MNYILNRFDGLIITVIGGFFLVLYFLWFIVNVLHINNSFLWLATVPLAAIIAYFWSRPFVKTEPVRFLPYLLLFVLLLTAFLFYLEPLIRYPFATIGIPNKDLHDAISTFISFYGYPPSNATSPGQTSFILNSQNGLYLGYPNVLHVFSAFLIKLGAFNFHATWLAITISLLVNSLSLFLLFKKFSNDTYLAAVTAGLFGLSSIRLPLAAIASIPMLFSYSLLLPALTVSLMAIHHSPRWYSWLIPMVAVSVLAASYSGTIIVFIGLLFLYSGSLLLTKDRAGLKNTIKLFLYSLPLLAFTLGFQHTIYWRNTFATARDFDPSELSQRLAPFDQPIYMLIYLVSLGSSLIIFFRHQLWRSNTLFTLLLAINLLLLLLIPASYLSSGLHHQEIHRLALLQPFFFIFFLTSILGRVKQSVPKIILAVLTLLLVFFVRLNAPIYNILHPELRSSFYNQVDQQKPYTLLSHLRLVVNDQIWSPEILDALNFLKTRNLDTSNVSLIDRRGWTQETIVDWSSVYLKTPVGSLNPKTDYLITISAVPPIHWQKIFEEKTVAIYKKT